VPDEKLEEPKKEEEKPARRMPMHDDPPKAPEASPESPKPADPGPSTAPDKAPEKAPEKAPAGPEGSVPDITKAKQLKDVITMLMEHHGIKDEAAMIAKCEELKATVPVLSRIADIPARVKRAMEVLS
jgi:hypothetical protein